MPSTAKFDYAAARKAGFTDEQIAKSLAAKRAAGVDVYVDRAEVDSARGGLSPTPASRPIAEGAAENPFTRALRERSIEALPTAGGFAGGLIGKLGGYPGAIAGATAGGGVGEGLREVLTGEPISGQKIALRGGEQGAYEAAGGAIAKGASKLALPLMRGALRLGKPIAGEVKVGAELFPDPVETALREGIEVNERGALKAGALRKAKGGEIGSLLKAEGAAGREISTRDVTARARKLLLDKSLSKAQRAKVFNELVTFYREKGARMDPELTQQIKRRYGGKYKGWNKGKDPLTDATEAEMAKEISLGAGEALDRIPGMSGLNQEYAALKGAQKAVTAAVRRPEPLWQAQAPTTYPFLRDIIGNKEINSKVAIALADPKWQRLYKQSPRLFFALLGQASYSAEPDVAQ